MLYFYFSKIAPRLELWAQLQMVWRCGQMRSEGINLNFHSPLSNRAEIEITSKIFNLLILSGVINQVKSK